MRHAPLVIFVLLGACRVQAGTRDEVASSARTLVSDLRGSSSIRADGAGFHFGGRGFSAAVSEAGELRIARGASSALRIASAEPAEPVRSTRGDDCIELRRAAMVEAQCVRDAGIEQLWYFETAPETDADLEIELTVEGATWQRWSAAGHHFSTADGNIVYGNATWIGADGLRVPIAVVWRESRLVLTVTRDTLAHTAYPAMLDPLISPEEAVTTDTTGVLNGRGTSIAHNGSHYLAVWGDLVRGRVFATRIANDGTFLTPAGIALASGHDPSIASDGSGFFVVYQGPPSGGSFDFGDLYAMRLGPDGQLLSNFRVHADIPNGPRPSLVRLADAWIVAWSSYSTSVTNVARVPDVGAITSVQYQGKAPSVGVLGSGFLLAHTTSGYATPEGVELVFYSSDLVEQERRLLRDLPGTAVVASRDGYAWVLYSEHRSSTYNYDLFGVVIAPDHSIGAELAIAKDAYDPQIGLGDTFSSRVIVTWTHGFVQHANMRAAVLDQGPGGWSVGPAQDVVTADEWQSGASLARVPGVGAMLVWDDRRGTSYGVSAEQIWGTRLLEDATPQPLNGFPISVGVLPQHAPALQRGSAGYLVAWSEQNGSWEDVLAALLDDDGTPVSAPIAIATGPTPQDSPKTAFGDGVYAVAYNDWGTVKVAMVSSAGAVVARTAIAGPELGGPSASIGSVAYGDGRFMVTWNEGQVWTASLDATGAVVAPAHQLTSGNYESPGDIVYGHGGFLVSYNVGFDHYVVLVDRDGVPTAAPTLVSTSSSSGSPFYSTPVLSAGTSGFLAVYLDSQAALYMQKLGADGTLAGPRALITTGSGLRLSNCGVTFDGQQHFLAWRDQSGVRGARLTDGGALRDTFVISSPADVNSVAVASEAANHQLVAYDLYVAASQQDRLRTRAVRWLGPGSQCSSSSDCESRFCVDGVCCNSSCGSSFSGDCQACSVAAGAAVDGTCGAVSAGRSCRNALGPCDVADTCDGTSLTCADQLVAAGTECRTSAGPCDVADRCNGISTACADLHAPAGASCRAAVNECDLAESCDGTSVACPSDALEPLGAACASGAGVCAGGQCATCRDVTVVADASCHSCASVLAEPLSGAWSIVEEPGCAYALGTTPVTLTVTGNEGSASCHANVTVVDQTGPVPSCNTPAVMSPSDAGITFTATTTDNCGASVVVTAPTCQRRGKRLPCPKYTVSGAAITLRALPVDLTFTWTAVATDSSGSQATATCSVTPTVR